MLRDNNTVQQPAPVFPRGGESEKLVNRPVELDMSLKGLRMFISPLPQQLLAVAASGRSFADSVAELIGNSAVALTASNARTMFLPEWVAAMRNHVKAVSTRDREIDYVDTFTAYRTLHPHLSPESVLQDTKRLLAVMRKAAIPLQVFDLSSTNLPEGMPDQDDVVRDLTETLGAAGQSLRELALPVSPVTAKAISETTFSKLETLELHFKEISKLVESMEVDGAPGVFGFEQMLQAVESSTGTESSLRELRMSQMLEAPFRSRDSPGYCERLCSQVKSLEVETTSWIDSKKPKEDDNIAMFIALFSNLEYLHWNGAVLPKHIETIRRGCPNLQRVSLDPRVRYESALDGGPLQMTLSRDVSVLNEIFERSQGTLVSVKLQGFMSVEQLETLGKSNPMLQALEIEIGRENIGALVPLLATHCRNMRRLHLQHTPNLENEECLGAEGWTKLACAVQSASAELREFSLVPFDDHEPVEENVTETLEAMVSILESLGERANGITFNFPFGTLNSRVLVSAITRLLHTAARHCTNLRTFRLVLYIVDADYHWEGESDRRPDMYQELLQARDELLVKAPNLRRLDLGWLEQEAQEYIDEFGVED